jgi:hypothetical protein
VFSFGGCCCCCVCLFFRWVHHPVDTQQCQRGTLGSPSAAHWRSLLKGLGVENSVVELGVGCRTCRRLWLMGLLIVAVLVVIIFVDSPVRDFFFP